MIDYFYQLNYDDSPQVKETTISTKDDFSRRFKTSKNDKKKRKHLFSWEGFPPPEPASKSKLSTVSKSEVVRHFHFDTPDNDLDNTELGINALMYALADKYG